MENNENNEHDNKEEPINDEEKETICLFDFEEEKCDATFVTKDKKLKMPSSFLCYVSKAFKEELEKNSNVITDVDVCSNELITFEFLSNSNVITDVDVCSNELISAISYYKPPLYKEHKGSFSISLIDILKALLALASLRKSLQL